MAVFGLNNLPCFCINRKDLLKTDILIEKSVLPHIGQKYTFRSFSRV